MASRKPYPTDLTAKEWALIAPYVPAAKTGGRPEKYPKREILNGILYILRGGCAWRLLPHDLPPWELVYHYFWLWKQDGTWRVIHDLLRGGVRVAAGRQRPPSAGIIDSPSVKTTEKGGRAATTRTSTSRGASATFLSMHEACSWPSWSRPPVCKTATGPCPCWLSYDTSSPACV